MRLPLRFSLFVVAMIAASGPVLAQDGLWRDASKSVVAAELPNAPLAFRAVTFDNALLSARLSTAKTIAETLVLPLPRGGSVEVDAQEESVMAPGLQARFPQIRTYRIRGVGAQGTLTVTDRGVSALLFTNEGAMAIDPVRPGSGYHVVYYVRDLQAPPDLFLDEPIETGALDVSAKAAPPAIGTSLKTLRLALAARADFVQANGGTVASAMAVLAEKVNRTNAVYERDMAVRFQLVENNDDLVFVVGTDPYSGDKNSIHEQNQGVVDGAIGSASYDIGHVMSNENYGGLAASSSVCRDGVKSRGTSGVQGRIMYDDLVLMHEIGHQMGGPHTWSYIPDLNGTVGINPLGVAPGPGYSILGYGQFNDTLPQEEQQGLYFHAESIRLMNGYVRSYAPNTCGTDTDTGNDVPVVTIPSASVTIPAGTPFVLSGSATDGSGTALTYTWEQMDQYGNGTTGPLPLFRSFDPRPSATRYFPDQQRDYAFETLPTGSETYSFRLSARDNVPGHGGVGAADMTVTTDASVGPFAVTMGTAAGLAYSLSTTATWDVAGTDGAPINTTAVDILFSTDGGVTFPHVLASGVPNDGSHPVTFPTTTTEGRLKVQAVGNVFFAVSPTTFEVTDDVIPCACCLPRRGHDGTGAGRVGYRDRDALQHGSGEPRSRVVGGARERDGPWDPAGRWRLHGRTDAVTDTLFGRSALSPVLAS